MDLAIPIKEFDPRKVTVGKPRDKVFRKIITLEYEDSNIHLYNLIIHFNRLRALQTN